MLWLVGAGTGDPDTLTRRAAELLAEADEVLAEVGLWPLVRQFGPDAAVQLPGPVERWPDTTTAATVAATVAAAATTGAAGERTVVRLYRGDGIAASAADRLALTASGRAFDVVVGVADTAEAAVLAALGAARPLRRPLEGRTVVVTRPEAQQAALGAALRRLGAEVVALPTIAIAPPGDGGVALRAALEHLEQYRWVVLTSANGARALLAELVDLRRAGSVRVAAIGPATAQVLADARLPADLVPEEYVAEGLLAAFAAAPGDPSDPTLADELASRRVLLVRAEVARDTLPDGLRQAGWQVDVVPAYRTVAAEVPAELEQARRAQLEGADVVLFSSPSTVERFVASYGSARFAPGGKPAVIAIGPVTAAAARRLGVAVDLVAERYDADGLVEAVRRWADATR